MPAQNAAAQRCHALYEAARRDGLGPALDELPGLIQHLDDPFLRGHMAKLYGVYAMRKRDYAAAARFHDLASRDLPEDRDAEKHCLVSLLQLRDFDAVIARGAAALARHPEAFGYHDAIAEALGQLGRLDEARAHGTASLILKDKSVTALPFPLGPIPAFDPTQRARNIIAFSLFGASERYCLGAIENARGCPYLYPSWTCRFYIDTSVPAETIVALTAAGAQVMRVDGLPAESYGTFWRYLVADDPAVDRYLVRDADSVINTRERVAVDEWLDSDRHFHVMRDDFTHADLVLAGMWGSVRGALRPMLPAITAFIGDTTELRGRTADQIFLREICWSTIRQSVLTHDSQFAFGERRDFPKLGRLPPGRTVGDWRR
jgi:hypothetical protein